MVAEVRPDYPSDWPATCAVAAKLGISNVNRAGVHADEKRCLECHRRPLEVPYKLLWTARHQRRLRIIDIQAFQMRAADHRWVHTAVVPHDHG